MRTGTQAVMVSGEVSPGKKLSALMPSPSAAKIEGLVVVLAEKHHFDLARPGYALCVRAPEVGKRVRSRVKQGKQPFGDLVICVCRDGYTLGVSKQQGAGFHVHYSQSWVPLRAFNANGCPYRNLSSANEEMCLLVNSYRNSDRALVTDLFRMEDAFSEGH